MSKEIDFRHSYLSSFDLTSIYFGGGTPSLLSIEELAGLFDKLSKYYSWKNSIEITLEANPDDITQTSLKEWRNLGINRLSIGLQSFDEVELRWMNRAHNAKESISSVKLAQDAGFDNISIDLIYGSKFQSIESWTNTLKQAVDLNTPHISSYNLTIEDKTVLGVNRKKGKEPDVNDDLSVKLFEEMQETLSQSDFIQYEISNFAKEGFIANHNSNYWLQKDYLGIGPSAHSFNQVSRQWNKKNNTLYIKEVNEGHNFFELEHLSLNDRFNEYVLTRLRTIWGCDLMEIDQLFGKKYVDHFLESVSKKRFHFETLKSTTYVLKKESRFLADGIASDLFFGL